MISTISSTHAHSTATTPQGEGRTKYREQQGDEQADDRQYAGAPMPPPLRKIVLAQVALGNPAVSPDGSHALYTRRSARIQGYRRHVWLVPLDGGRARALTSGDVRDAAPQMTPQGDRVLFLRDEQVWAVPL